MTWWQGVLLGLLQGITEFLPVSSSGHLALAQYLIPGFSQPGVTVDVLLHLGTALAVVWAERENLVRWLSTRSGWRLIGVLAAGTAVTGVVGLALKGPATAAFSSPGAVGAFLVVTGVVVLSTRYLPGGNDGEAEVGIRQAAVVGLVQGLAVFPGISRSGSTIAAGLGVGLDRSWAARFSFLLSVPAVLAASGLELVQHGTELWAAGPGLLGPALLGALVAGISGYAALKLVIRTVSSRAFHYFGIYCLPLGLVVLALSLGGIL